MPYLQLPEVLALTKFSSSTLYRLVKCGDFPAPVKRRLGRYSTAWKSSSLNRWLEINGGLSGEKYLEARRANASLLRESSRRYEKLGGRQFGFWSVTAFAYVQQGAAHWVCQCRCGKLNIVAANKLKNGRSKSCGCKPRHINRECRTHHPLYPTWILMRARCLRETHPQYRLYGAVGIGVCDAWVNDFWAFQRDMGPRPAGSILTRIDHTGPFSPDNCRWGSCANKTFR